MDIFDEQVFYELMQKYRHTPITQQGDAIIAFEEIKAFIREQMKAESTEFGLWLSLNLKKSKNKDIDKLYKNFKNG